MDQTIFDAPMTSDEKDMLIAILEAYLSSPDGESAYQQLASLPPITEQQARKLSRALRTFWRDLHAWEEGHRTMGVIEQPMTLAQGPSAPGQPRPKNTRTKA